MSINDTMLEYYGLTKKDIEKIKEEKSYTLEEVEKSLKMQWLIEDVFGIKITDTDLLLDLYTRFRDDIQNSIKKESRQISETSR